MPAAAGGRGLVRRGLVGTVVVSMTTALLLLANARPAMNHATLLSTTPTGDEQLSRGPEEVELSFDESVEPLDRAARAIAVEPTTTIEAATGSTQRGSSVNDPDRQGGNGIVGVLAAAFLALVVVGCTVGFARSARALRENR